MDPALQGDYGSYVNCRFESELNVLIMQILNTFLIVLRENADDSFSWLNILLRLTISDFMLYSDTLRPIVQSI